MFLGEICGCVSTLLLLTISIRVLYYYDLLFSQPHIVMLLVVIPVLLAIAQFSTTSIAANWAYNRRSRPNSR